jgi:hypothetical protein
MFADTSNDFKNRQIKEEVSESWWFYLSLPTSSNTTFY